MDKSVLNVDKPFLDFLVALELAKQGKHHEALSLLVPIAHDLESFHRCAENMGIDMETRLEWFKSRPTGLPK